MKGGGGGPEGTRRSHRIPRELYALVLVAVVVAASAATTIGVAVLWDRGPTLTVETDKDEYALGEPVEISAELRNLGLNTIKLTFNVSPFEITLRIWGPDGTVVFWSPQVEMPVVKVLELGPRDSLQRGWVWDQMNITGAPVDEPGKYTVSVGSGSNEYRLAANTSITLYSSSARDSSLTSSASSCPPDPGDSCFQLTPPYRTKHPDGHG